MIGMRAWSAKLYRPPFSFPLSMPASLRKRAALRPRLGDLSVIGGAKHNPYEERCLSRAPLGLGGSYDP